MDRFQKAAQNRKIRPTWSKVDESFLKDNYRDNDLEEIAAKLGRTRKACERKLHALGLHVRDGLSEEKIKKFQEMYPLYSTDELVEFFDRSRGYIFALAAKLGLHKEEAWSEEQKDLAISLRLDGITIEIIAEKVNKSPSAVRGFLQRRGISPLVEDPSNYRGWTKKQLLFLKENYTKISIEEISKIIDKSIGSIYYILNKEGIELEKIFWSEKEIEELKRLYPDYSNIELEKIFSRSEGSIQQKAASFNLRKNSWWSIEEIERLKDLVREELSYKQLAEILNRPISSIHYMLEKQELTKECKRWTESELKAVEELAQSGNFTFLEIANSIGATREQIISLCYTKKWNENVKKETSLGNKKLKEYLRELYPGYTIKTEYHIGEGLKLDAFVKELKLGCEYDGEQHFKFVPRFHQTEENFAKAQKRDLRKNELCVEQEIILIRIKYNEDFTLALLKDKIDQALVVTSDINNTNFEELNKQPKKPKAKIPKPIKYNWPKGKKIPSRPFPRRNK